MLRSFSTVTSSLHRTLPVWVSAQQLDTRAGAEPKTACHVPVTTRVATGLSPGWGGGGAARRRGRGCEDGAVFLMSQAKSLRGSSAAPFGSLSPDLSVGGVCFPVSLPRTACPDLRKLEALLLEPQGSWPCAGVRPESLVPASLWAIWGLGRVSVSVPCSCFLLPSQPLSAPCR